MGIGTRSRAMVLIAAFLSVGLFALLIAQSLRIVDFGRNLRETAHQLEVMTSVADAEAAGTK